MTQEGFILPVGESSESEFENPQVTSSTGEHELTEAESSGEEFDNPSAGAGAAFLFKMRGRDDGRPFPGYVSWIADFPDFAGTQTGTAVPPLLGSLVPGSVVLISLWSF